MVCGRVLLGGDHSPGGGDPGIRTHSTSSREQEEGLAEDQEGQGGEAEQENQRCRQQLQRPRRGFLALLLSARRFPFQDLWLPEECQAEEGPKGSYTAPARPSIQGKGTR